MKTSIKYICSKTLIKAAIQPNVTELECEASLAFSFFFNINEYQITAYL